MLDDVRKVRDMPSGRRLCVLIGGRSASAAEAPALGTIREGRVHVGGADGKVVASFDGRLLRAEVGGSVLASIVEDEIRDGIDGPILATFDGGVEVGLGRAAYLLAL